MDHLTATGDVVLVSLGGKPEMPEVTRARKGRKMEDEEKRGERVGEDAIVEERKEITETEGEAPWSRWRRRTSSASKPLDGRRASSERPEGNMRLRKEKTNHNRRSERNAGEDNVLEEEDSDRTRTS